MRKLSQTKVLFGDLHLRKQKYKGMENKYLIIAKKKVQKLLCKIQNKNSKILQIHLPDQVLKFNLNLRLQ